MADAGVDIAAQAPQRRTDEIVRSADVVVTRGCGDERPFLPGVQYEDWPLDDPAGLDTASVRFIRDEIRRRVENLLGRLGTASAQLNRSSSG
jgi:arsenate reductase